MKRTLATLLFASSLASPTPAQVPEGDLAELLPADTMVFLSVDELAEAFTLDPDGAVMTLLDHPAVEQAYEGAYDMLGDLKDKDFLLAMNLEEDELVRLLGGRITIAIPEILLIQSEVDADDSDGGVDARVELSFELGRGLIAMADFGGTRDRLEELLENVAVLYAEEEEYHDAQLVIEDFENTKLYTIEREDLDGEVDDPMWFALVDELLLLSDREETLKDFVDLARQGTPEGERLSEDARYTETLDRAGEADALLYINLGELLPLVNEFIEFQIKDAGPGIAMFLRAEDLLASLRLDAVKSLFGAAHVEDEEAGLVFGFTHVDTDLGLHTLLSYSGTGVELPPYFSSDFHSASVSLFDLSAMYEKFDEMLRKASPFAHNMLGMQISQIERDGFKLEDAVLNNLDGMFVELLGYPEATLASPEDHPTQAYVLRVKDAQTLAESLAELSASSVDEDPIEFMNERIHALPLPFGGSFNDEEPKMSWAVVENQLVVTFGEAKMVENIIAHIKNPGESLLEDEDLMAAFDALPSEDLVALGFIDVADLVQNTLRGSDEAIAFQMGLEADPDTIAQLEEARTKIDEIPDVSDIRYYLVSKTYKSDDAFVQRMLLRPDLED